VDELAHLLGLAKEASGVAREELVGRDAHHRHILSMGKTGAIAFTPDSVRAPFDGEKLS